MTFLQETFYKYRIKAPEGFHFDVLKVKQNKLLDTDEWSTVQFKYENKVITWESPFNLSNLTEEDMQDIFKCAIEKDEE